jgi:hypothetical protein
MKKTKPMVYKQLKLVSLILALLLIACDRTGEFPIDGSALPVRIHSLSVLEGGSKSLLRSQEVTESVFLPLSDGLLMEATIERDTPPLRAGQEKELAAGALFRVIAVEAGTVKYVSHGDFTVGGASTVSSFSIEAGQKYDFICLSYNNSTLPSATAYRKGVNLVTLSITSSIKEVLWWKKTNVMVNSAADVALSIELNHMLTKVRVALDCSYNGWKIAGVGTGLTFGLVAISGIMNLGTGEITGGAGTHILKWSLKSVDTSQYSEPLIVVPKASSTLTIHIPVLSVTRDGLSAIPTIAANGKFVTTLKSGVSYTLRIRLRTPIWAGSNIYWDGDATAGRLTFDVAGQTQNEGFQGVFFKFGSLVGISPALVNGDNDFVADLPLYVPDKHAATRWRPTTAGAEQYTAWDNIPHMDESYHTNSGGSRDDTSVIDATLNIPGIHDGFRGDICQYLGEINPAHLAGYRLPTSSEFGSTSSWTKKGTFVNGDNSIGTPFGRMNLLSADNDLGYATNATMGNVVLPTSGFRGADGKLKDTVGFDGYYWPASEYNVDEARIFEYYGGTVSYPIRSLSRSYAFPIRCVKK